MVLLVFSCSCLFYFDEGNCHMTWTLWREVQMKRYICMLLSSILWGTIKIRIIKTVGLYDPVPDHSSDEKPCTELSIHSIVKDWAGLAAPELFRKTQISCIDVFENIPFSHTAVLNTDLCTKFIFIEDHLISWKTM